MIKIKKFFETPLKATLSSLCIIAVLAVLGTGTAFAASAIAESNAIGAVNAQNFAFVDAGIDPVSAQKVHTEFDFEQGQFVYEVEFTADGTEYEYWVKASNGSIVKKELKIISAGGDTVSVTAEITLNEAKNIALADAGLSVSDVTFTETKLDRDGQLSVYEISFRTEEAEYEYEVNSNTGAVYSKSKEILTQQSTPAPTETPNPTQNNHGTQQPSATEPNQTVNKVSLETAKNTALADAGVKSSDASFTKAKQEYDDGVSVYDIEFYTSTHKYEYEISADTGKIVSRDVEAFKTNNGNNNSGNSGTYIGIDKAKSVALSHAGLSASEVTFSKAKLENDDGHKVYEIEFYYKGIEYEYTIEAISGTVLEYEQDRD